MKNLQNRITELESKIKVLEEENAFLAERYQDSFLLGSILKEIILTEDYHQIFHIFLEKICLLKDFTAGLILSFNGVESDVISFFSQLHDDSYMPDVKVNPVIYSMDDNEIRHISYDDQLDDIISLSEIFKKNCSTITVMEFSNLAFGKTIALFCNNAENFTSEQLNAFRRINQIVKTRLNNLFLLNESHKMNQQLEDMVDSQSTEITIFKQLYESSAEATVVFNEQLQVMYYNQAFAKTWRVGSAPKESIDFFALFHPDDLNLFSESEFSKLFEGNNLSGEARGKALDGSIFPLWYRFQRVDASYGENLYALMGHNIAKEKENELKYKHLIENLSDGIYILYQEKFELVNKKLTEITGYTLADLTHPDFDFFSLFHADSLPYIKSRLEKLRKGQPVEPEYRFKLITKNGETRHIEASVTYFPYKDGIGTQGIIRDITNRLKIEEELHQAQKMESIGRLAAGVAHDFNNILTVINGYGDLLLKQAKMKYPELVRKVEQINVASEHAGTLTRQLLTFSRKQKIEPKILPVKSHMEKTAKILQRLVTENVVVKINPIADHLKIYIDPGQLDQILINLIVNARDAMPGGGRVTINVEEIDPRHIPDQFNAADLMHDDHYLMFQVSDTGTGIAPENLSQIFEPFFTTKASGKGTGLGLATVYGITKQNGGSIAVDSTLGEGTTFSVLLPVLSEKIEEIEFKETESVHIEGLNRTIMVVEDNDQVRDFITQVLIDYQFRTFSMESPYDAIKFFKDNANPGIDLLITDVIMPGMNGKELYLELSREIPDLKVLFMSGYTDDVINSDEISENGWAFINKPLRIPDLLKKIDEILNQDNNKQ